MDKGLLYLLAYLLVINLFAMLLMAVDKSKAERDKWRIPEKTLFIIALIGGSIGSIAGMYMFRHKTKHAKFIIGMPAILILQIAAVVLVIKYCFN